MSGTRGKDDLSLSLRKERSKRRKDGQHVEVTAIMLDNLSSAM
jgi:hypothetical protein